MVAGQAWHWIDPVVGARKAATVLRPKGRLAVFWNVFEAPTDLAQAFAAVNHRVLVGPLARTWDRSASDAYGALSARAAAGIGDVADLGGAEEWRQEWDRTYARDEWLEQVPTFGGHSLLSAADMDALLTGIGGAIDEHGGRFVMRYTTVTVTASRVPSS